MNVERLFQVGGAYARVQNWMTNLWRLQVGKNNKSLGDRSEGAVRVQERDEVRSTEGR